MLIIAPIKMLINSSLKCQQKYECHLCCELGGTGGLVCPTQEKAYLPNRKQNRILQAMKFNNTFSDLGPHM